VNAAMHVRVLCQIIILQRIEHRLRFLARRRVVEINQRLAVNPLPQNWKLFSDTLNVESGLP
jgi:hypothetical protein